jgi:hypothetical protein
MIRIGKLYIVNGACIVVLLLTLVFASTSAAQAATNTAYTQPRWWAKYLNVSAPGFAPAKAGSTRSVTIGPNVDVSNEPGPQSETSIAIDPNNPSQLVAGSNEIDRLPMRGYFSSDGGLTWGGVDLPLPPPLTPSGTDFGSDPGVAWDTRGNAYYSYIVVFFNGGFTGVTGTELAVARSSDGGRTWTPTYFAFKNGTGQFNDKPLITVDTNPNSPFRDTIYVTWDTATGNSSSTNDIIVSRSTDGGRTFSDPVKASASVKGANAAIGADPFVGPDGTLYVAWNDIQHNAIVFSHSTDGGLTFGVTQTIAPTQVAFDIAIPAMNVRRALVYPACGADISSGSNRRTLYCAWMDLTATNGTDLFLSRSTDGGAHWSAPLRVNDDPAGVANDQFNQWLAVDPIDGSVNLSWNDTRLDPSHVSTHIFYARSTDGGQSFAPNVQVTTAPTNETCCGAQLHDQYGDYEGIAARNGISHPVWTDRRDAVASLNEEVFTAVIRAK